MSLLVGCVVSERRVTGLADAGGGDGSVDASPDSAVDATVDAAADGDTDAGVVPIPNGCLQSSAEEIVERFNDMSFDRTTVDDDSSFDARDASWRFASTALTKAVQLGDGDDVCWVGGRFESALPDTVLTIEGWENRVAIDVLDMKRFTVASVRAHGVGTGIDLRSDVEGFSIEDVYLSRVHGDCVRNRDLFGGDLVDSLLDGCNAAIDVNSTNGTSSEMDIERNLVRIEAMQAKDEAAPLHRGFFQIAASSNFMFDIRNNTFAVSEPLSGSGRYFPPDENIDDCTNNTLIWLGDGEFTNGPADRPNNNCLIVVDDNDATLQQRQAMWLNAVAEWKDAHPWFTD